MSCFTVNKLKEVVGVKTSFLSAAMKASPSPKRKANRPQSPKVEILQEVAPVISDQEFIYHNVRNVVRSPMRARRQPPDVILVSEMVFYYLFL